MTIAKERTKQAEPLTITAPNFQTLEVAITGNAPYVQHAFSQKMKEAIGKGMETGTPSTNKRKKAPKNFEQEFELAKHQSDEGWYGIPCAAFRNALVSACRVAGFPMTRAKLSIFVLADGYDKQDAGIALSKITKVNNADGEPEMLKSITRIKDTINVVARPLFKRGWEANVRIRWDADQFTATDILNLMLRVGSQVGVGEGRPDSKQSTGMGWGTFDLHQDTFEQERVA
jgi:hypothetical protein|tara:strand:+ start:141 stop:830 length:690 start_codon:yes stop_codon:yes gene_type:complete